MVSDFRGEGHYQDASDSIKINILCRKLTSKANLNITRDQ